MEVNLTKEQKEYVEKYNAILNRVSDIQHKIEALEKEAHEALEELNNLRLKERETFPDEQ
jgi:FtsZ-binding cell division protein ZapB